MEQNYCGMSYRVPHAFGVSKLGFEFQPMKAVEKFGLLADKR